MYLLSPLIRQYVLVFVLNLSVFTSGMSMAWPSPVLVKLRNAAETPLSRPMTEDEGSWMVSLGFLCGILADLVGGRLLDVIGRKKCLFLTVIPKVTMGLLYIFASEAWMLILGRTIMVLTDCYVYVVVPVYAAEIADKEQRGALGSFVQLVSSSGALITLTVGPYTSYRTFNIIFTSLIVITSLPFLWLPDSPFFLHKKGHTEEAIRLLKKLRKSDAIVKQEVDEFNNACNDHHHINRIKLLKNKTFLKSLILGLLLSIGVQIIGYNAVAAYMQTILESTHTNIQPELASVVIGVLQVVAGFSTIFITTRFNRRTILIWSLSGFFLGMVGLATFFEMKKHTYKIEGFLNYLPIVSLVLVICSYCAGIGSLFWTVTAELFNNNSRAFGVSSSLISTATLIFLTTKYFPLMSAALGPAGTYWFFSSMTAVLTILLGIFLPETKGKSFDEIQIALGK